MRLFLLTLWWTARILAFVFIIVLGLRPSLLQFVGIGEAMIAWLLQPPILVPLTAVLALFSADWLLQWRVRRRQRALQRLAVTFDLPVRKAYKYLRFESQWATTMPNANEGVIQARDILEDAFSGGALFVWGREYRRYSPSLQPILNNSFWTGTMLNGFSLGDFYEAPNGDTNAGFYLGKDGQRFKDLHVSRRQVEDRWPRANWFQRWRLRRTMGQPNYDADARARGVRRDKLRQWQIKQTDLLRVHSNHAVTWLRHTYSAVMEKWRR